MNMKIRLRNSVVCLLLVTTLIAKAQDKIPFEGIDQTWRHVLQQNLVCKKQTCLDNRWWSYEKPWPLPGALPTGQASPLPNPYNPSQTAGAFPFSANPGDQSEGWDCSTNLDFMPSQFITYRLEFVHRESSVPYFAGHGGVTSQTGLTTSVLDPAWRPDLVKSESKVILAILLIIGIEGWNQDSL
jgi:hypothetical protein